MEKTIAVIGIGVLAMIVLVNAIAESMAYLTDMIGEILIMCGVPLVLFAIGYGAYKAFIGYNVGRIESMETALRLERLAIENEGMRLRLELVQPVGNVLPVSRQLVMSNKIAGKSLQLMAANIDANRTHPSGSIHYSVKNDNNIADAAVAEEIAQKFTVPSFSELLSSGKLPSAGFLLGFDAESNEPVYATWKELYSCVVNGGSGTGKSTLLRGILGQAAVQGAEFLICDPHFGAGEESLGESLASLRGMMVDEVASNDTEILKSIDHVTEVGKRRLAGHDTSKQPLILIVDETTALLNRSAIGKELTAALSFICQETRKVGVYAICLGQMWKGTTIDTALRDSFASVLSCPAFGNNLGNMVDGDARKIISKLVVGQALYYRTGHGSMVVNVPNCTSHDIELVASQARPDRFQIADSYSMEVSGSDTGSAAEAPRKRRGSAAEAPEMGIKERTVLRMVADGESDTAIIKEVWGISGGRNRAAAKQELDQIVSQFS